MRKKLHPYFKWHLLFWTAYGLFKIYHEFIWTYTNYEELSLASVTYSSIVAQVTMLPPKMLFTYWVAYKILPSTNTLVRKWIIFIVSLLITVVLYRVFVILIVLPLAYRQIPESQPLFSLGNVSSSLIDILLVTGIGTALILLHRQQKAKRREQELENEKIASELLFLKQQTNPHFLLNTLNNIYALARKKAETTPEAIMKLSKLMRYVLYESSCEQVSLKQEMEIIDHYIDLERLRYGDRLHIDFSMNDFDQIYIAPLILLPLVENAFKHGASEIVENSKIAISLIADDEKLIFSVVNSMRKSQEHQKDGIGLKNLRRQLELQYPEHTFETFERDGFFTAKLTLDHRR